MKNFSQQPTPVPPQVEIPPNFPEIPQEVLERFPSAAGWQQRLDEFWTRANQAIQQAQSQTSRQINASVIYTVDSFLIYANGVPTPMFSLDSTGVKLGDVLVINTPGRKVFIGAGNYENDDTPFYIDTLGRFSLGASLTWDPDTDTLTITGVINATSGTIGGFDIGADYIRDTANSFGLASTVTAGDDIRQWAGATFANRATAPYRVTESGTIYCAAGAAFGVSAVEPSRVLRADGVDPDGLGPVRIGVVGDAVFLGGTTIVAPSLLATHEVYFAIGKAASNNNWAGMSFYYAGNGSTSNRVQFSFYGGSPVLSITAAGVAVFSGGINGAVGATTPNTGAFTTLSATGNFTMTNVGANAPLFSLTNTGTGGRNWQLFSASSSGVAPSGLGIYDGTGGALVAAFYTTGLAVTGTITTSAPTGGAGAWLLGTYTAGIAVQAGKVRIKIGATEYDLLTA